MRLLVMEKRNPDYDLRKSDLRIKSESGKTCVAPGCEYPLTTRVGPGDKSCCREHQLSLREYGGPARLDRPHTFARRSDYVCTECGWAVLEDERLAVINNEMVRIQVARTITHGDHIIRQADGGDDSPENVRSVCVVCHAIKTMVNEDYLNNISKDGKET